MRVNYYVRAAMRPYARLHFRKLKRVKFFSELLKVEYPWDKYDQIVVRDYVSGAMENTSQTSVFGEFVYKTDRGADGWKQWIYHSTRDEQLTGFGNLFTAESRYNTCFWNGIFLPSYSQYLWDEYRHGKMKRIKCNGRRRRYILPLYWARRTTSYGSIEQERIFWCTFL